MKTLAGRMLFMTLIGFIAVSCSTTSGQIKIQSQSVRTDVFTEVDGTTAFVNQGTVDLVIKASIKTHSGDHPLWWIKDSHGSSHYPVVFNIDGQAAVWEVNPRDHVISKTGTARSEDPEAGSGAKYVVEKRLRLKSGEKSLFFCLPEEGHCTNIRIRIQEGKENNLEFKPIYRKPNRGFIRNFKYGIDHFEVFFNGDLIQ